MRVNRTLLYAGVFLVAIGGVVAAADLGVLDERLLADALGLWPLAVIALGLGLVLRRTRVSLSGGLLAAAVPGLLLGSAFAVVPDVGKFCGHGDELTQVARDQGSFATRAAVSVKLACGSVSVTTAPGSAWSLDARASKNARPPTIDASSASVAVSSTNHDDWLNAGHDDWDLTLPTGVPLELSLSVNAGRGDIDLADADVEPLSVDANAADVLVDASTAHLDRVSGDVNFGRLSILLPDADVVVSLDVGAGTAQVCAPPELGLRITTTESMGDVSVDGRDLRGTGYQSPNYTTAEHRADLSVDVDFGTVEINPIGGCR